jgi:hypothetical protein
MFDDRWPDRGQWSFWLVQRRGWPGSFCGNLRSEWLVHGPTLDFRESPAITILHSWIVLTYNDSDVSVMFRAISIHFKSQATPFILYIWCLLVILFFFPETDWFYSDVHYVHQQCDHQDPIENSEPPTPNDSEDSITGELMMVLVLVNSRGVIS